MDAGMSRSRSARLAGWLTCVALLAPSLHGALGHLGAPVAGGPALAAALAHPASPSLEPCVICLAAGHARSRLGTDFAAFEPARGALVATIRPASRPADPAAAGLAHPRAPPVV